MIAGRDLLGHVNAHTSAPSHRTPWDVRRFGPQPLPCTSRSHASGRSQLDDGWRGRRNLAARSLEASCHLGRHRGQLSRAKALGILLEAKLVVLANEGPIDHERVKVRTKAQVVGKGMNNRRRAEAQLRASGQADASSRPLVERLEQHLLEDSLRIAGGQPPASQRRHDRRWEADHDVSCGDVGHGRRDSSSHVGATDGPARARGAVRSAAQAAMLASSAALAA